MTTKKVPLADLDWDDLRLFLQVQRKGRLSEAARQLRIDHSTVSRRLSQLELCLGGPLFERQRAGLKPTELAHILTLHAEAMERAVMAFHEESGGTDYEPSGSVRIAMMEGIGTMFVARHLEPLLSQHAKLRVELVTSSSIVNVSRREADVFVSFFKPADQGLACEPAGSFALYLYASRRYLDLRGTPADLADLVNHHFVGYIDDMVQFDAVRWLDELVLRPAMSFQSNSMLAQMTAAASGLGLVLLPKFSVVNEPDLVPVLADSASVTRMIWVSVHHDLQYSTRIRAVTRYLHGLFAARYEWLNGSPLTEPRG